MNQQVQPGNIFQRVMSLGDVEILADPAVMEAAGATGPNPVPYRNSEPNQADQIFLGIGGNAAGLTIGAGATVPFQTTADRPFKPLRVCIASTVGVGLLCSQIKIGPTELIAGQPIPIEMISEVSLANVIRWPTIQTSQAILFALINPTGAAVTNVQIGMLGIGLR
jgi:hypothetical protein